MLLSSKLQISFASVHLTLCFITVARGATRFSSPLHKVITPTSYCSILHHYLLHYYYYSILGQRDYFPFIDLHSEDRQEGEQQVDVTSNTCHEPRSNQPGCNSGFSAARPRAELLHAAHSVSYAPRGFIFISRH